MIKRSQLVVGSVVEGEFNVRRLQSRVARNGNKYMVMELEDGDESIKAIAWENTVEGRLEAMQKIVQLTGTVKQLNGEWFVQITSIRSVSNPVGDPISALANICPCADRLWDVQDLVNALTADSLRDFLLEVLADNSIAHPFVTAPASRKHHHAYPGGLLVHSLECAEIVASMSCFKDEIRDLGMVAALLHDVGKVRTLTRNPNAHSVGLVMGHDLLTLEVLATHLQSLDRKWPDGAAAVRYLLTWRPGNRCSVHPVMTVAEAIVTADHISAGLDREAAAFATVPEWQTLVTVEGVRRWRPRMLSALTEGLLLPSSGGNK